MAIMGNKVTLNNKNIIVLVAAAALVILLAAGGFWLLNSKQTKKGLAPEPTQAPLVLSKDSLGLKQSLTKTDKKSGDLVLENNDNFKIIYLIYNDEFIVFVNKSPYEEIKQKSEGWFRGKGFSALDLCLLKISFTATKETRPDFSSTDAVPFGCATPIVTQK